LSTSHILLLGAIAGLTIFIGLPFGRMRQTDPRARAALCSVATGILVFLFWDVLTNGVEPVESALQSAAHDGGSWGVFVGRAFLLAAGFVAGLMGLVYYDRWVKNRRRSPLVGPGAAAADEFASRAWYETLSPARQLALLIAVGIGVHNFGEGLAIGQSAAAGDVALALTLIIGFGLHNATEGFGIVGPLGGEVDPPSWSFLAVLGLIGGGPTFLGTLVGQAWVSEAMSVAFFAVAAGSILYVVQQLFGVIRRFEYPTLVMWMVVAGVALGFATDFVFEAVK
jgi:ZIP family zinc transporter